MPADELALDFDPLHTLGFLGTDWIEAHCRVPGGVFEGEPLTFNGWQLFCTVNHYRITPDAVVDQRRLLMPFVYRRSVIVGPQKCGKSPWGAGMVLLDAVGPSLFAGWAEGGERYRCKDHGCGCGWEYEYQPGEAMGIPRRKSLIGLLAYAESQTQNVYEPLQTMIHSGPLAEFVHVREGFVRTPNRGKIVPLSAAARSKLGQPLTGGLGDESGLYTDANKVLYTWQTMRRGIAAMQGRPIELTNPWDQTENSAAQQAFASKQKDIFRYYRKPPTDLDYKKVRDRHKIHVHVYADSPWVDPTSIDAEASELVETDPAQAERFYGNRLVQTLGSWCDVNAWNGRKAKPREVAPGTQIVAAFDGSDVDDWTGFRCETRDGYQFTPKLPDGRPMIWNPADHGGQVPRLEVSAALDFIMSTWKVARFYADPPYWESECDAWAEKHGEDVVIRWYTRRDTQMHAAAERLLTDVRKKDSGFTHDGCEVTAAHVGNARKRYKGLVDEDKTRMRYVLTKPGDGRKIDMAIPSILAHEAHGDVTAAGWPDISENYVYYI